MAFAILSIHCESHDMIGAVMVEVAVGQFCDAFSTRKNNLRHLAFDYNGKLIQGVVMQKRYKPREVPLALVEQA